MGVLFFEGFETIGTETGNANRATTQPRAKKRWTKWEQISPGSLGGGYLVDGADQGYAWRVPDGSSGDIARMQYIFPQEVIDEISVPGEQSGQTPNIHIIGFRVHTRSVAATLQVVNIGYLSNAGFASFSGTLNLNIVDSTDIELRRGGTVLATAAGCLTAGDWSYIEWKFRISDTGGAQTTNGMSQVRVNGTEVINFTGDTDPDLFDNTTSRDYIGFNFALSGGSSTDPTNWWGLDDIYALFPDGSPPYDDFLGPVQVVSYPIDGDSTPLDWTPSTGTDHYTLLDENGAVTSDYVESDTDGQQDQYTITNFEGIGTVFALKIEAEAINTVGGTPELTVAAGDAGTTYTVDDTVNTEVFTHYRDLAGFDSVEASIEFGSGF